MPIAADAEIEITAFEWVPDFAKGYVRDIRPRWACEELGLPYRERLISAVSRPEWYYRDQPWGQVPHVRDGDISVFERPQTHSAGMSSVHSGSSETKTAPPGSSSGACCCSKACVGTRETCR